jgi:hypothetical protein
VVELSCSDRNSLGHGAHRFSAIAQWFVHLSLTHNRWSSIASFRATATTTRFLALFPRRSASFSPHLRRSLSAKFFAWWNSSELQRGDAMKIRCVVAGTSYPEIGKW